jgi:hypothetical protein
MVIRGPLFQWRGEDPFHALSRWVFITGFDEQRFLDCGFRLKSGITFEKVRERLHDKIRKTPHPFVGMYAPVFKELAEYVSGKDSFPPQNGDGQARLQTKESESVSTESEKESQPLASQVTRVYGALFLPPRLRHPHHRRIA